MIRRIPKNEEATSTTTTKVKTANEQAIDAVIAFAKKYAADDSYKYKKWTSDAKTHQCPLCHTGSGKGWNCIGFVSACFFHGAGANITCSNSGLGNDAFFNSVTLKKWRERNGSDWDMPKSVTMGDVIICYEGTKYKHTALYMGDEKIVDATSSRGIVIRKYSELSKYKKKFFRYTGSGKFGSTTTTIVDKKSYTGEFPSINVTISTNNAEKLGKVAKELAWPLGTKKAKYEYKTGSPTSAAKTAMRARGYDTKIEQSDCGYFMNTVVYHALGKKLRVIQSDTKKSFDELSGFKIVFSGTSIKQNQLKKYDIVRYMRVNDKGKLVQHTGMYVGNGYFAEGGREDRFPVIRKNGMFFTKKKKIQILRAVETTTTRDYIQFGDNGDNTKLLQQYLNWYKPSYNLVINGKWDNSTDLAVKDMQTDFFGASGADGKVGEKTLKEMEAVKK